MFHKIPRERERGSIPLDRDNNILKLSYLAETFFLRKSVMANASVDLITIDFTQGEEFNTSIVNLLAEVWESSLLSDCTLVCQDQRFKVHTLVLIANSGYFKEFFRASPGLQKNPLQVKLEVDSFRLCLEFLYHGKLHVEHERLGELANTAKLLRIQQLYFKCRSLELADTKPNINNCLRLWATGHEIHDEALLGKAVPVALANFSQLIFEDSFVKLPYAVVKEYICHGNIVRQANEELLTAVMNWVGGDKISRLVYLLPLLGAVPLESMGSWYLKSVMRDPIVENCDRARLLIKSAICPPRALCVGIRLLSDKSCANANQDVGDIALTDTESKTLCKVPAVVPKHGGVAACLIGQNFFVSGVGKSSDELWKLNTSDFVWQKSATMKFPRQFHCMASCFGTMYIFGGSTPGKSDLVETVAAYCIETETMFDAGKLNGSGCANMCCCTSGHDIIVAGSLSPAQQISLEVFSSRSRQVEHRVEIPGQQYTWVQGIGIAKGSIILAMEGKILTMPVQSLYQDSAQGIAEQSNYEIGHFGCALLLDDKCDGVFLVGGESVRTAFVSEILGNDEGGWHNRELQPSRWIWAAACCIKVD